MTLVCNVSTTDDVFDAVNGLVDANRALSKESVTKIVALGASLINGTFNSSITNTQNLSKYGLSKASLINEGVGGDTSSDILSRLPTILLDYTGQEGVIFVVSVGGNNVSNTRPFETASLTEKRTITADIYSIISAIEAEGHTVYMSNISRRYYTGATEEEGSLPYNKQITEPIIKTALPKCWDNVNDKPIFDMYEWSNNNPSYISADGIHPTSEGYDALWDWWFDRLVLLISSEYIEATGNTGEEIFIDLGSTNNPATGMNIARFGSKQLLSTVGVNSGAIVEQRSGGASTTNGNGNAGDTSLSLTNDILLTSYMYTGSTAYYNLCNLKPNSLVRVTLTASKNTSDGTRVGIYSINEIEQEMDAELIPAPQVSWDVITNEYGTVPIKVTVKAGSSNAYLSGISVLVM